MFTALPDQRPATFAEIHALTAEAQRLGQLVTDRIRGFHKAVDQVREQATTRYTNVADLDRRTAKHLADRETSVARNRLRGVLDADLRAPLRELASARELLARQREYFGNPVATLDRETLGRRERAEHAATLAHAGPATLHQAALRALRDDDTFLAAAVVARLHDLPKERRPLHPAALAERIQPEHVVKTLAAMDEADALVAEAVSAVHTLEQPKTAALAKVAAGLRKLTQPQEG